MRLIDADALIDDLKHDVAMDQDSLDYEELTDLNREKIQFDKDCKQNAIDLLQHAPTIEPERKKGKWIDRGWSGDGRGNSWHEWECSECKHITKGAKWDFCPNCGADMRTPVDIAKDIVHKIIDNTAWSDTVDTAEMHKAVDDKYAEIRGDANADVES